MNHTFKKNSLKGLQDAAIYAYSHLNEIFCVFAYTAGVD